MHVHGDSSDPAGSMIPRLQAEVGLGLFCFSLWGLFSARVPWAHKHSYASPCIPLAYISLAKASHMAMLNIKALRSTLTQPCGHRQGVEGQYCNRGGKGGLSDSIYSEYLVQSQGAASENQDPGQPAPGVPTWLSYVFSNKQR